MKNIALKFALVLAFLNTQGLNAFSAEIEYIGPVSGPSAIIGQQMAQSAGEAKVRDSACDATIAASATSDAILAGARIIIGLPCIEALDAAATYINDIGSDAIIIALGVQVPDVTNRAQRENWPVFRLGPSDNQEAVSVANYIKENWRSINFAIIEDGTLYGRQLAETVRQLLADDNLLPVFTDTYRPLLDRQAGLVRRIAKSGATHVFLGGDAYDLAIIGRDAAELGFDLQFAGGAALRAPKDEGILPNGTVLTAVIPVLMQAGQVEYSDYAVLTAIATTIAEKAIVRMQQGKVTPAEAITMDNFDTSIGPISFGADGENDRQWFGMFEVEDGQFNNLDGTN